MHVFSFKDSKQHKRERNNTPTTETTTHQHTNNNAKNTPNNKNNNATTETRTHRNTLHSYTILGSCLISMVPRNIHSMIILFWFSTLIYRFKCYLHERSGTIAYITQPSPTCSANVMASTLLPVVGITGSTWAREEETETQPDASLLTPPLSNTFFSLLILFCVAFGTTGPP